MSEEHESNMTKLAAVPPPKVSETDAPETDTPSDLLWHFTSLDVLPKILLGDDGLLAGHTSFMDDPDDCALRNRLWKTTTDLVHSLVAGTTSYSEDEIPVYSMLRSSIESESCYPIFAACFSNDPPNSKMWQHYTPQGGVSIGFDKDKLLHSIQDDDSDVWFEDCDYDSYEQRAAQVDTLEREIKALSSKPMADEDKSGTKKGTEQTICNLLAQARKLIGVKRPTMKWEQEKRLVVAFKRTVPANRLRFIAGKPFVTIPFRAHIRNYVREIKVSPFGDVRHSLVVASFVAAAIDLEPDNVHLITNCVKMKDETTPDEV